MRRFIPYSLRQFIRRVRHGYQIRHGTFGDTDPLFWRLAEWVQLGDVAIDVGAAVGTFSIALSELVGPEGRVIALEPLPQQFEILTCNATRTRHQNITCVQFAAGAASGVCRITVPDLNGVPNWYMGHVAADGLPVLVVALDDMPIPRPVAFLKVDAEGQDFAVIRGAQGILKEDGPVIFIESNDDDMHEWLRSMGYEQVANDPRSPNRVLLPARGRG